MSKTSASVTAPDDLKDDVSSIASQLLLACERREMIDVEIEELQGRAAQILSALADDNVPIKVRANGYELSRAVRTLTKWDSEMLAAILKVEGHDKITDVPSYIDLKLGIPADKFEALSDEDKAILVVARLQSVSSNIKAKRLV